MNLLFLSNNLGNGGAERVLVNLANGLALKGHNVTLRVLANEGINREKLSDSVKYEYVFKKAFRGMNYLHVLPKKFIYGRICRGKYDVVIPYLHGVLTNIVSYAPSNQKTVAWLHANMEKSPFMLDLKKHNKAEKCFETYNRVIAVSDDVKHSFKNMVHGYDRISVLYNTFDVAGIRTGADEDSDVPDAAVKLVSVGKLSEVKGYLRLLAAFERIVNYDHIDASLTIVGEGEQRGELEVFIAEHGLGGRVKLAGFDVNPYKYIAAGNLFVCSSYTEGFSSVVAESLILGVPVITTDCAGMAEMLGANSEYGLIVENSDEALYSGLHALLTDAEKLKHYTKKAKERSTFFSTESTVGAVEKMLEEVINEKLL